MSTKEWTVHNPSGTKRVIVTKQLPGQLWLERLADADCRVEVCQSPDILSVDEIVAAIGDRCDGVIGQLTEDWSETLFAALESGRRQSLLQLRGRLQQRQRPRGHRRTASPWATRPASSPRRRPSWRSR